MVRVFVVDYHAAARRRLRVAFEAEEGIRVVAEADSGSQAVGAVQQVGADVVLMSMRPPGDGIAATRALSTAPYNLPVVVVGSLPVDAHVFGAIRAGAVGFVLRTSDQADIARAIRAAAHGDGFLAPELTLRVFAAAAVHADRDGAANSRAGGLTPREVEVVRALCRGPSDNQAIARQLHVEPATVKGHLKHIMTKLDLHSRAELVVWAFRHQIAA